MLLQDDPCPWQPEVIYIYAAAGNLSMLQWLHVAGYQADVFAAFCAAEAGHASILAWLLSMKPKLQAQQRRANLKGAASRCPARLDGWPVPTLML